MSQIQVFRKLRKLPLPIFWRKSTVYLNSQIFGRFNLDIDKNRENCVVIAGTHRSGSTWLSDVLNTGLKYRYIAEPIRIASTPAVKEYDRLYVRPEDCNEFMERFLKSIFKGEYKSFELNKKNRNFICRGRLVKDVGINLMLKWIKLQFPSVKIVYIIRNPFLVVSSCKTIGWVESKTPQFWLRQQKLLEDHLSDFKEIIDSSKSQVEKIVLEWCILNYVPLRQFSLEEWKLVYYDDLVRCPEPILKELFQFLGIDFDPKILGKFKTPSHTSDELIPIDPEELLGKWRKRLSIDEQEVIRKYVNRFKLDRFLPQFNR